MDIDFTEISKMEAACRRGDDEYDVFTDPNEVAAKRGLVVVFPEHNQLQIDIDSDEQFEEFQRRYDCFDTFGNSTVVVNPSASGLPHRHVTITHPLFSFREEERIMWQAALNDDPVRVFLNTLRLHESKDSSPPCRFFEKPTEPCNPPPTAP